MRLKNRHYEKIKNKCPTIHNVDVGLNLVAADDYKSVRLRKAGDATSSAASVTSLKAASTVSSLTSVTSLSAALMTSSSLVVSMMSLTVLETRSGGLMTSLTSSS